MLGMAAMSEEDGLLIVPAGIEMFKFYIFVNPLSVLLIVPAGIEIEQKERR
mgnify:CR=1 FL=1